MPLLSLVRRAVVETHDGTPAPSLPVIPFNAQTLGGLTKGSTVLSAMLRGSQKGHWNQLVRVLPKLIPAGSSWKIRNTTWSLLCIRDLHSHCVHAPVSPSSFPSLFPGQLEMQTSSPGTGAKGICQLCAGFFSVRLTIWSGILPSLW